MIRQSDGFPPAYKTFPSLQEARRRQGNYFPDRQRTKNTLANLVNRYETTILAIKENNTREIKRHLNWWKKKLGKKGVFRKL